MRTWRARGPSVLADDLHVDGDDAVRVQLAGDARINDISQVPLQCTFTSTIIHAAAGDGDLGACES